MPSVWRLWCGAACLLLIAVVVTFFAVPGVAQTLRAALVRDVDNSDRSLVSMYLNVSLSPGSSQSLCGPGGDVLYDVPTGKRLVIDHINLNALMDSDAQTPGLSILGLTHYFPPRVGKTISGRYMHFASYPVTLFRDGPAKVYACAFRDSTVGGATIRADVTGHLVDLQ